jgi:hypothetical protein
MQCGKCVLSAVKSQQEFLKQPAARQINMEVAGTLTRSDPFGPRSGSRGRLASLTQARFMCAPSAMRIEANDK